MAVGGYGYPRAVNHVARKPGEGFMGVELRTDKCCAVVLLN
jgi:hypothetical protein